MTNEKGRLIVNRMNEDRDDTYASLLGDLVGAVGDFMGVIPAEVLDSPEVKAELKKITKITMKSLRLAVKDLFE